MNRQYIQPNRAIVWKEEQIINLMVITLPMHNFCLLNVFSIFLNKQLHIIITVATVLLNLHFMSYRNVGCLSVARYINASAMETIAGAKLVV